MKHIQTFESVNEGPDHTSGLTIKGTGFNWKKPFKKGDEITYKDVKGNWVDGWVHKKRTGKTRGGGKSMNYLVSTDKANKLANWIWVGDSGIKPRTNESVNEGAVHKYQNEVFNLLKKLDKVIYHRVVKSTIDVGDRTFLDVIQQNFDNKVSPSQTAQELIQQADSPVITNRALLKKQAKESVNEANFNLKDLEYQIPLSIEDELGISPKAFKGIKKAYRAGPDAYRVVLSSYINYDGMVDILGHVNKALDGDLKVRMEKKGSGDKIYIIGEGFKYVKTFESVNEMNVGHAEVMRLERILSSKNKKALVKALDDGTIKTSKDLAKWVKTIKESLNEGKVSVKKGEPVLYKGNGTKWVESEFIRWGHPGKTIHIEWNDEYTEVPVKDVKKVPGYKYTAPTKGNPNAIQIESLEEGARANYHEYSTEDLRKMYRDVVRDGSAQQKKVWKQGIKRELAKRGESVNEGIKSRGKTIKKGDKFTDDEGDIFTVTKVSSNKIVLQDDDQIQQKTVFPDDFDDDNFDVWFTAESVNENYMKDLKKLDQGDVVIELDSGREWTIKKLRWWLGSPQMTLVDNTPGKKQIMEFPGPDDRDPNFFKYFKLKESLSETKIIKKNLIKKYGIPSFALDYDGGAAAPEAGVFLDMKGLEPGDVVDNPHGDGKVIVTHKTKDETIATRAHNIPLHEEFVNEGKDEDYLERILEYLESALKASQSTKFNAAKWYSTALWSALGPAHYKKILKDLGVYDWIYMAARKKGDTKTIEAIINKIKEQTNESVNEGNDKFKKGDIAKIKSVDDLVDELEKDVNLQDWFNSNILTLSGGDWKAQINSYIRKNRNIDLKSMVDDILKESVNEGKLTEEQQHRLKSALNDVKSKGGPPYRKAVMVILELAKRISGKDPKNIKHALRLLDNVEEVYTQVPGKMIAFDIGDDDDDDKNDMIRKKKMKGPMGTVGYLGVAEDDDDDESEEEKTRKREGRVPGPEGGVGYAGKER